MTTTSTIATLFVATTTLLIITTLPLITADNNDDCIVKGIDATLPTSLNPTNDDYVWPFMWRLLPDDVISSQDSRQEPNKLDDDDDDDDVDATILMAAGVQYRPLDPTGYDYPTRAIPWEPSYTTANDPTLAAIRTELNFSYADIITVGGRVDSFWEEHFHEFDTIRYIINGSGYFDLRDVNDEWVRFSVKTGDFFLWPGGIYHRFTVDDNNFITAMRLFQGSPVWNSFVRDDVKGNHSARMNYINTYLCGEDPDAATAAPTDNSESAAAADATIIDNSDTDASLTTVSMDLESGDASGASMDTESLDETIVDENTDVSMDTENFDESTITMETASDGFPLFYSLFHLLSWFVLVNGCCWIVMVF